MKNILLIIILLLSTNLIAQSNDSDNKPSYKINNPKKVNKRKKINPFTLLNKVKTTTLILSVGHNILLSPENRELEQNWWSSTDREYGLGFKQSLGKSNKYKLFFGLSINIKKVDLVGVDLNNSTSSPGYVLTNSDSFEKVRIGANYVQFPIGLIIPVFKKKKLFIGGHIGLRYKSFVEKEYKSINDEDVEASYYADFGMNRINYGLDFSFGYKFLKVFAKYDINPLFKDGNKYNMFSFGIRTY